MKLLRLIHNGHTVTPQIRRSILIDDIDLENAEKNGVPRHLPNKQEAYLPELNPYDETQRGYIDLIITDKVQASYEAGKIHRMIGEGWVLATIFDDSALDQPNITNINISSPISGVFTITGTGLKSLAPDVSSVLIGVNNVDPPIDIQLSEAELLAAPYNGTITDLQIQFDIPFTSTLGQLLRSSQELEVVVYSDGLLSDPYIHDHVVP